MASVTGMFVPTYQGLSAVDFVRPVPAARAACFPFDVPDRLPFYRARNAIYHLFRALLDRHPGLTVLAPDYTTTTAAMKSWPSAQPAPGSTTAPSTGRCSWIPTLWSGSVSFTTRISCT
ncbi:MAG: hypothetical protein HW394_645 [Acidobacteria bacterium]|nr:hypothetical protein [Acidobacteriota bacterium]